MPQSSRFGFAEGVKWAGLVLGPVLALLAYALLPQATSGDPSGIDQPGLTDAGRAAAAVGVLMACWWLTEAIPISATALVPIALMPAVGAAPIGEITARYGHPLIFLFLGGFILGLGMERWGLHRRIALITIRLVGVRPTRLIAGFMIATAMLSMFVSNTATAIMMLPIGTSVIELIRRRTTDPDQAAHVPAFATCLMLAIAYAASIGGLGTLIGTPPNTVLAGFVSDRFGVTIGFVGWMKLAIPVVLVMLPIAWLYLTRVAQPVRIDRIPGGRELIDHELRELGPVSRGEWIVFAVFLVTAASWILRPQFVTIGQAVAWGADALHLAPWAQTIGTLPAASARIISFASPLAHLSDTGIAIAAALALFAIPVDPRRRVFAMDWETAIKLPWGVLLLFGGGLALAHAISVNGVDSFIGATFISLRGAPVIIITLAIAAGVIFLTELTSNTAVTSALLPVLAAAAVSMGVDYHVLLLPATLAASCAFMLPVATPPNAIVFSSSAVTIQQMVRAGFWLNLIGIIIITLMITLLGDTLLPPSLGNL